MGDSQIKSKLTKVYPISCIENKSEIAELVKYSNYYIIILYINLVFSIIIIKEVTCE